ncbi:MAG: hypothetical protein COA67_09590 [Lutibacter sp.]|nr:MAG: hypothetical protein COA67_09590 [Lutibacter sp.]
MKQTLFKHKYTLLLFTLLFTLLSCSKDDDDTFTPTLPEATQTGENTFGCYIDGNLLTPRDGSGTFNNPDVGMKEIVLGTSPNYDYNEIRVRDFKSGNGGIIKIHFIDLHQNGEGTFTINKSNCEDGIDANNNINITCRWLDETTQTYKWYCSIENGGVLSITKYDFNNKIYSGTFSCTMQNRDDSNDTIEITQGRFDIKWNTLIYANFP